MASSPSYGERPPLQGFRRSFTVPHRQLSHHEQAGLSNADADSDTLFAHPSVKIISFSPPPESIVSKSGATHANADYPIDTVETLPWRSRTEDLVASGRMIIEKVRGSVWFLKCGSQFVYSILRNSQCWCVDGECRFVLRKGRFEYYRLELPNDTEEERAKIEELKAAFSKVLKFERTPCPFKRGFHVDLPDDAITPRRKGKWTKKEGSLPATPDSNTPSLRRTKGSRSWSLQAQSPVPVPESRRQSDYSFAKRLYPPPPRRDTLSGLRPGTPSSTVSSDEDVSHGRPENLSDSGSSMDEPHAADKQELPVATARQAVDADEYPVTGDGPASIQPVDDEETTSNALNKSMYAEDAPPVLAETPTPAVAEVNIDHVESIDIKTAHDGTVGGEPHSEKPIDATVQIEDGSRPRRLEDDEVPHELSLPERPESPLGNSLHASETKDTAAADDDEPSSTQSVDTGSLNNTDMLEADSSSADVEAPDGAREPETEGEMSEDPGALTCQPAAGNTLDDTASIASAAVSFHTLASDEPISPPSPSECPQLTEHFDPRNPGHSQHKRGVSEMTITASNFDGQTEGEQLDRFVTTDEGGERPSTPRLTQSSASDDSWPNITTPPNIQGGLRERMKSRESRSRFRSSSDTFTPQSPNHGNHMTSVLLQKALNLALVKPIELAVLLVHILARIAGGASLNDLLTGDLFKQPDQHRRNSSFPDRISPQQDDYEDDFGVPLRGGTRSSEIDVSRSGRGTDADSLFELD